MDSMNKNDTMSQNDGYFKTRHPLVVKAFEELDNYLVVTDGPDNGWCCVYFSSNSIYFPSDEETFEREILKKNRFEFYGTRLCQCSKHIFLRDIHKQWYLRGINSDYDSIEKLAGFLKKETDGYRVITIGSSAGGYAAALFGTLIHADYAICIDAQFSLYDEAIFNHLERNPIIAELRDKEESQYFDLNNILGDVPVYYFQSAFSPFDQRSGAAVKGNKAIRLIPFKSTLHGGPFNPVLYEHVFSMKQSGLDRLVGRMHRPKLFLLRYAFYPEVMKKIIRKIAKRF